MGIYKFKEEYKYNRSTEYKITKTEKIVLSFLSYILLIYLCRGKRNIGK